MAGGAGREERGGAALAVFERAWYAASPVLVQNAATTLQGLATRLLRRGRAFGRTLSVLEESQWLSSEEHARAQDERAAALMRHCYEKVPYYRRVMRERGLTPDDVTSAEDLKKLPFLTKEIVREEGDNLVREDVGRFRVHHTGTSGTTGTPLRLTRDLDSITAERAFVWRAWRAAGLRLSDRLAVMRGDFIVPPAVTRPPYWRHDLARRQLLLSMLHLSPETAGDYFDAIRAFGPRAFWTFPSGIDYLARLARERGEDIHLDFVLTSSEPLYPSTRALAEDVFSCRVVDYYGQAERAVFAMECEERSGLHVAPEYGVTELVEPEEEAPEGLLEIVGTPFLNYAMPLVRYRTGDLARPMEGECACGRRMQLISPIETRVGGDVVLPDGRRIAYLALTRLFAKLESVRKSQVIQDRPDHLLVKVVPGSGFGQAERESIATGIRSMLASDVTVDVRVVEDIPREKSGKLRWFVSELDGSGGGARLED